MFEGYATTENLILLSLWLMFTLIMLVLVVPKLTAKRFTSMFGVAEVEKDGKRFFAPCDADGEPLKIPVARTDKDGKVTISDEYCPVAYSMPVIAAIHTKTYLTSAVYGKSGKLLQQANKAVMADMPMEQAATAMALEAFAKGQYGKALMAYLAPRIAASINQSGNAGQALEIQGSKHRGGGGPI